MELHDQRNQSPTLVKPQRGIAWIQRVISWSGHRVENAVTARRILISLSILIGTFAAPIGLVAASGQSGSQYTPTVPGGLVAWLICNGRKRNRMGGWLLFFYWQLYSGLIVTAVFFAINIQSYIPENFDSSSKYPLFLASTVPSLVLFVLKCAVATLLYSAPTWDMLKGLRWVMVAELSADVLAMVIDSVYFPDNVGFNLITIFSGLIWIGYMFRSKRVRHIFYSHDWDVAVNLIHPIKLKMAT
jgi:hypothetical protein